MDVEAEKRTLEFIRKNAKADNLLCLLLALTS